jgi:methionyl-tRNA formyltransferase
MTETRSMRVLFFGYSQTGHRAVKLLLEQGHEVICVVTHKDDPGENLWYRTPAEAANENQLIVVYAEELGLGTEELATYVEPDLILSVFYRKMLSEAVLATAKVAALNLHPSLLPAYRGRAPINWVLVNGETETGVTLHHMVKRADAGDIVGRRRIEIAPRETAFTLYQKVEQAGIELLAEMLPRVASGTAPRIAQGSAGASKFGGRRPEDGRIDWTWPAARIDALVRAVAPPWPGAFAEIGGRRVEIHAGEPGGLLPGEDGDGEAGGVARPAPGTLRWEGDQLCVATADRWFRIQQAVGLEHPLVPTLQTL